MAAVFETDGIFSQNNELRMRSDLLLACMHVRLHASAANTEQEEEEGGVCEEEAET